MQYRDHSRRKTRRRKWQRETSSRSVREEEIANFRSRVLHDDEASLLTKDVLS
jgi:hypothetical protein